MKILFIILFVVAHAMSLAQEQEKIPVVTVGIKIGMSGSSLSPGYTDISDYRHTFSLKGGFQGGGFLQIAIGKKLLIQPEILFVSKGAKETVNDINSSNEYNSPNHINYIEFPVNILAKLSAGPGHFILGGGPAFAFARNNYYSLYNRRFDAGLNMLTGYQWPIGFIINLNFTKGFSNVFDPLQGAPKITNTSFGLCVGYVF